MKTLAIIAATLLTAAPAYAQQNGWTSENYGNPNTTYYRGTGANQGWSGSSETYGNPNTTYYNFQGPNGEHQTCTAQNYGNPNTTYTSCN